MKKKRVLALLLALSMAVDMNGVTVLAAGTNEGQVAEVSLDTPDTSEIQENTDESGESSDTKEDGSEDQKTDDSKENLDDGTKEKPGDGTGIEEKPGDASESGNVTDGGSELEDITGDDSVKDDDTDEITEGSETEDVPLGEEPEQLEESSEEGNIEEESKLPAVARMVTFTDDTGMRVTYDANEAETYDYTVNGDVLTGVTYKGKPLSGEVALIQPEGQNYTSISSSVFSGNTEITYVKIPSGVTSIGDNAFKGCTKLKGVYLPTKVGIIGEGAFEDCFSLTQLALPKSVTEIKANAFCNDSKLFMVHMKDVDYAQLKTIGENAFKGCKSLEKFCSDGDFVLTDSLETIGANAFEGCSSIPYVLMQDNVTTLGSAAFKNCSRVTKVNISSSLNVISASAFENCTGINSVTIGDTKNVDLTIEENAFKLCYNLGSIDLPDRVVSVKAGAFDRCSNLKRVYIKKRWAELEDGAFPENEGLYLVGTDNSCAAYDYVYVYKHYPTLHFVNSNDSGTEEIYKYSKRFTGVDESKIKMTVSTSPTGKDIETTGGVKARTKLYIVFDGNSLKTAGVTLVEGSLKCNGEEVEKDKNGFPSFFMPDGGAFITAEFVSNSNDKSINGSDSNVTTELSNGDTLKVGQKTKLFLVSDHANDNNLIPSSKISYRVADEDKANASVASDGTITALAPGSAVIYASVKGGDGNSILKSVKITITDEAVKYIRLKAYDYSSYVKVVEEDGLQTAYVDSGLVKGQSFKLTLKATAYDSADDDMATAFTWSTSDGKVATLAKKSTTSASSENTVTIPKGTDGEATITVTATNKDKTKVTQNFLISVRDYKPRLVSSSITINPNKTEGAVLEVIGAYSANIKRVELYEEKQNIVSKNFKLTKDTEGSTDNISRYYVEAESGVKDKTYTVRVRINDSNSNMQILKITVKSSSPNPKVAFQKNQPKIDLFKANDGTEVKMLVTNLGTDKISGCKLEPLTSSGASTYADDKLFTNNFTAELGEESNTVIIKQISSGMKYTSKKKPAVTGYLVLYIAGYDNKKVEKKFKITIPTQTVKPAYMLDRTSDTYNTLCGNQTVKLKLLDKKTKEQIELSNEEYDKPIVLGNSTPYVSDCTINSDGELEFVIEGEGESISKGAVNIKLHKKDWAADQSLTYTYNIKTSTAKPKISLKGSTVTLNNNYADTSAEFAFVSNQKDTVLNHIQKFEYDSKVKNRVEYDKITINTDAEGGTVTIEAGIAPGSYKFTCPVKDQYDNVINNVTLTVKVNNTVPTVAVKGNMSLNLVAKTQEKAEITLTPKNLPEKYVIDEAETLSTIVCTTKNALIGDKLEWDIEDGDTDSTNKLVAKLKSNISSSAAGTYKFKMTPIYQNDGNSVRAKDINFSVKVYNGEISVNLSAKGKLNLLDRLTGDSKEYKTTNSITYTPTLKNVKDTVVEARIFDVDSQPKYDSEQSKRFEVEVLDGKLYVVPKEGAILNNNETYEVKIWVKLENYKYGAFNGGGTWVNNGNVIKIKTAQVLPKVTTNVSTVNLYLSNKNYTASFVVSPKEGAVGNVSGISFDEKDEKALSSFADLNDTRIFVQKDGSLKVTLKLKNSVSYSCNTTNKVKMYIEFEGQGKNTPGTAITMNVKINK